MSEYGTELVHSVSMQRPTPQTNEPSAEQLAEEARAQFGDLADEYAEVRANVAEKLGDEDRSEDWKEAAELIEQREAAGDATNDGS